MDTYPQEILDFWFSKKIRKQWFKASSKLDAEILEKYEALWQQAADGYLNQWVKHSDSALALILILDQFPLNMFRGQIKSFSTEQSAVKITRNSLAKNFDQTITKDKVAFLFMPLMHSENLKDQNLAVKLFKQYDLQSNLRFAKHHREIIIQYGRFPHRNEILGRKNSSTELKYLASKHAFKG